MGVAIGGGGVEVAVGVEVARKMKSVGSGDAVGLGVFEGVGDGDGVRVCCVGGAQAAFCSGVPSSRVSGNTCTEGASMYK